MAEKKLSGEIVFEGRSFQVSVDKVKTPDNRTTIREVVLHADCVAVVAVDAEDNILLVRQFRYAVGKELLEIPAGGIDPGEIPEQAVEREMREETGLQPRKVVRLGGFYSSPGFCSEYLHLFLATDMIRNPLTAEDTAGIKLVPTPKSGIPKLIAEGKICDSKSFAGLLQYLASFK